MKRGLTAAVLLLSVLLAGCGTLIGYMSECFGPECRKPNEKIEYYQAVKTDVALWNLPKQENQVEGLKWVSRLILIIDVPISAVVDTLLFPFQAISNISKTERSTQPVGTAANATSK